MFVPPAPQPAEPVLERGDEMLLPPPEFAGNSDFVRVSSEEESSGEDAVDTDILLVLPPSPPVLLEY